MMPGVVLVMVAQMVTWSLVVAVEAVDVEGGVDGGAAVAVAAS